MHPLFTAILHDDRKQFSALLKADPGLVALNADKDRLFDAGIFHWLYVGDTPLHLAAAGYRVELVRALLDAGADANATANRRRSGPLHYASDGYIGGPDFNEARQVKTIRCLLKAGACVNAPDRNGATPLHRAVRTRCAAAVKCLINSGADTDVGNKSGSTPYDLALRTTGRGGSGEPVARAAQQLIIRFLSPQT